MLGLSLQPPLPSTAVKFYSQNTWRNGEFDKESLEENEEYNPPLEEIFSGTVIYYSEENCNIPAFPAAPQATFSKLWILAHYWGVLKKPNKQV